MSFWSTDFMNARREQWMSSLGKLQYRVANTWIEATINSKTISGNKIVIVASFPRIESSQTITAMRILDSDGNQAGYQEISVVRAAGQGILVKFELPIYEKESESE